MAQILIDYANDIIEKTADDYEFVLQITKQETGIIEDLYKRFFAIISLFFGSIIALTGSQIMDFSNGAIFLIITGIIAVLVFWKRQKKLRQLNDVYGLYIAVKGNQKSVFQKFKKDVHYWNYLHSFSEKEIRNSLDAFADIEATYSIYLIEVYEKIFPIVRTEMKKSLFVGMLSLIEQSLDGIRVLRNISSKPLPYFIQEELSRMIQDYRKYVSEYYKESDASSTYEVYVNFSDYVDMVFGGPFGAIKLLGFKKYSQYLQNFRNNEFLLDKNLNLVKTRTKQ